MNFYIEEKRLSFAMIERILWKLMTENQPLKDKEILPLIETNLTSLLEGENSRHYERQIEKIRAELIKLDLSNDEIFELAAHLVVRLGDAQFVIEREKKFEVLMRAGYGNFRSRRKNAAKPRTGGRNKIVSEIKEIMRSYKLQGMSFKDFLENAMFNSINDLVILENAKGLLDVTVVGSGELCNVKESTIRDWYSDSGKKKSQK